MFEMNESSDDSSSENYKSSCDLSANAAEGCRELKRVSARALGLDIVFGGLLEGVSLAGEHHLDPVPIAIGVGAGALYLTFATGQRICERISARSTVKAFEQEQQNGPAL